MEVLSDYIWKITAEEREWSKEVIGQVEKKKRCKCFCVSWVCTWSGIAWSLLLFSCQEVSNSLGLNELQHARLPCPSLAPWVCSNSCPLSQWCHPTILSSVAPFSSCSQSFLASGSFPVNQLFASGGQRTGASASASASLLLMNIQGWYFRIDWFDLLNVQGTLASILRHSAFLMVQLSHPYTITGKTMTLTVQASVSTVMSLLFNTV